MKRAAYLFIIFGILISSLSSCTKNKKEVWAEDILGNPDYPGISFGAYRQDTRDSVPSVEELMEDFRLMEALGIKIIRTYNTQDYPQTANILKAIDSLKREDTSFEMYVMLGAWIDCKDARKDEPDHDFEDFERNQAEINAAVEFARLYPDIVKIIAVGNEAMVHWATAYFVKPAIILKWVNYLQDLKNKGELDDRIWITSSDNFASWGGGDTTYHVDDLTALINAVDYISLHTYPYHDTHYNPSFWGILPEHETLSKKEQIDTLMKSAVNYAISQYDSVVDYVASLGIEKDIHIGESGWSTFDNHLFHPDGSKAADEYKAKLYYDAMRRWTNEAGISLFYFEAFNEKWKDAKNPFGSENHFGLFTIDGKAKYVLWDEVDRGVFSGLKRNGNSIIKSYDGNETELMKDVYVPKFSGK